jgi:phosphatidylglycerol:prolipoprotein diacylglycerol transferase
MTAADIDDFLVWATLGVVLGGRIGYVLFYQADLYAGDPLEIFRLWHGGMSFHGAVAGVVLAIYLFTRRRKLSFLSLGDIIVCSVPIGQFFGRLANFVNGELWGRATDVPWAMVFPHDPSGLPRHPSQLYEATLEGVVMFMILFVLERRGLRQRPGAISGVFLIGLAIARIVGELFREPDKQLGFLIFGTTMGQLLSIPMILIGIWLIWRAKPRAEPATA